MDLSLVIVGIASLLGSGILFRHQRMLTYVATAGGLFEAQWLLLTWLGRTLLVSLPASTVFTAGGVLLLAGWLAFYKQWSWPYATPGSGRRDITVVLLLIPVIIAAWSIARVNGWQNYELTTHGFYNGDTATLAALVQRSFSTPRLVTANPFAGNGSLEYPTLVHAALATFFMASGISSQWLSFLPLLTYVQILFTVPLLFLVWDVLYPEPSEPWKQWLGMPSRWGVLFLQVIISGYVVALAWDAYVYPQSHFFITGLFLLLATLLLRAYMATNHGLVALAGIMSLLLVRANAVTGAAALALFVTFCFLQANKRSLAVRIRSVYLGLVPVMGVLFLWLASGKASFGIPHFSYTAALDMARLAPVLIILLGIIFYRLSRFTFLSAGAVVLSALAFFTFFFSNRDIIVENASRFFYHAVLVGFPLLLPPLIQTCYWLRRELFYTTHTLSELVAGWGSIIMAVLLLLLPAGASMASAHDNLWFKDKQGITTALRPSLWWIEDNTTPDSVFLASPNEPWAIPYLTGRALLRTDYWLSPDDIVLEDVKAAFAGDIAAREKVLSQVDYVYLTKDERASWEPSPLQKVFDNGAVVIYKAR